MPISHTRALLALAAAAFGLCMASAAAASGDSLVCCKADTGWKIPNPFKSPSKTRYRMVPAQECTKANGRVKVGTHLCRSACRKRPGDWEWRNDRCQRPLVRDRRGFARQEAECRNRGSRWEWKHRRCQRAALRDRRVRPRMVCCRIDVASGIGARLLAATVGYADYRFGMITDTECLKKRRTRQIVSTTLCVKACRRAGAAWEWKNNRCQRAAVRDKRDPRELECRRRGADWIWKDGKCQRALVRDKRGR